MKKLIRFFSCGLVILGLVGPAAAQAPPQLFFPANVMPPPNGMYLSPPQWHALYANGVVISNVTHRGFTGSAPPPPTGTSATHTFNSELDFDISFNNGTNFTTASAPAIVTVNLQAIGTGGGQQTYNTKMLQLNLSGGTLPAGVQLRGSTTQPSIGQTTIAPVSGGFRISSFFDVFTELSVDGGQTWSPSAQPGHLELRVDPTLIPPAPEPTPLLPPPTDQYVTLGQSSAAYASGAVIRNVRHKFFGQSLNPLAIPVGSTKVTQQFPSTFNCDVSIDGGQTFTPVSVPAMVSVTLLPANSGPPAIFDTEMIQLDMTIPGFPAPLSIRESPSLPSYGETAVRQAADGSFQVNSFFDIFPELSLDGGQSWQPPTNGPVHVELQRVAQEVLFLTPNLPPTNGQFNFPPLLHYPSGIILSNIVSRGFNPSLPPPPPGQSQFQDFSSSVDMMLSLDNGGTFTPASAPAIGVFLISNTSPAGAVSPAQYFQTELLQLNISGGTLPQGLRVRESPTKASLGRSSIMSDQLAGGFRVSSFFDIFTELSLNDGQAWNASLDGSATVPLHPWPPYAPYVIKCPSNITVFATSPSGAVVNYTFPPLVFFPDCPFCCFAATGVPASGSLFPIGTTTVAGSGSDGCGEHPTCSFTVTVLQPFIYAGLADSILGHAVLALSTNDVGTNPYAPPSLILSNISSGGSDGFHLYLGAVDSALLNFQPFPTTETTGLVITATGPYGSDPNHLMGTGAYTGGSDPMIRADFSSLGASSLILEVRDDDNHLIFSNTVANAAWVNVNTLFPPPCTNTTTTYSYWQSPDHICYRFCKYGCNCTGTNCYVERVACFRPDIASLPLPRFLTDLQLLAQDSAVPGSLTIQNEELGMFGLMHSAIGRATFESHPGILMLNNLGSSGQDGVSVNLKQVGAFEMTLAPTTLETQGACWNMTAFGSFNGLENAPLGTASLVHSVGPGGGCLVSDDFHALGATQTRVEIYQGSQLVGSVTSPNGLLGTLPVHGNLIACGMLLRPLPGFKLGFDSGFVFMPPNSTSQFTGDEIHLLAVNPNAQVQALSQFVIQSCNMDQFAILGEAAQPTITGVLKQPDGRFEVDGQGAAAVSYRLEATANLGAQWTIIGSAMSGIDGSFHLFDARAANPSQQFYHIVTP